MYYMKKFITKVISNSLVCENIYEMQFVMDHEAGAPLPGQFCTIRVSEGTSPLLRRPFGFSNFNKQNMITSMVYKKCGPATEILAGKTPGDSLDVIGPLGTSFSNLKQGTKNILVAGGTGFGPIFFLNNVLKNQKAFSHIVVGCRSKTQIPFSLLASPDNDAIICTEDGSAGFKGTVVDYLNSLQKDFFNNAAFFCCGPKPMLKACHEFALERGIECAVSLEQVMACGVGACMGCAVKIIGENPYSRVCTEGPVFNSKTVLWT
jgi:dihydroorotate dehydrogenase electron transfer subunit